MESTETKMFRVMDAGFAQGLENSVQRWGEENSVKH